MDTSPIEDPSPQQNLAVPEPSQPRAENNNLAFLKRLEAIIPQKFELSRLLPWLEVGLIVVWALWVTRVYLNLDATVWPMLDQDYPASIQLYHNWPWLYKCGLCVLWNGSINGGGPMLADIYTAILHPALVGPVLLWGGINGAKITLVLSAIMAGLAQWWLAKVLKLGLPARLWVSFLAVIGGHLWARMEYGTIAMTFSIAASSLFFAPMLDLAINGRRLAVVGLGVMMASAALSGQGYMQVGILFGALPPMIVFLFDSKVRLRPVWRGFAVAALITILLTSLWWLSLGLFWPYISKASDPAFSLAQKSVLYSLLNLFIDDITFLRSAILGKAAPLSLYSNYISWVPLAFIVAALSRARGKDWRVVAYFLLAIWMIYLTSTAWIFEKSQLFFGDFFSIGRDPSAVASLAIPLILGLAAWGLDSLIKLPWPSISISFSAGDGAKIGLRWLLLIPALWSLYSVNNLTSEWRRVEPAPDVYPIKEVTTATSQWVATPGIRAYTDKAIDAGLKVITPTDQTLWNWGKGRVVPEPYLVVTGVPVDPATPGYEGVVLGFNLLRLEQNQYASIQSGDQKIPCKALAHAGDIDVVCETAVAGTLTVYEYNLSGWNVSLDGKPAQLSSSNWLQVDAPAGTHTYKFRYRPWEAGVGLVLTLAGWGLSGFILWKSVRRKSRKSEETNKI
jgi:hypothetical protein